MRIFIAVEFEPEIKSYFTSVQDRLKKYSKRGNYTDENNFHLTLRFIGEVKSEEAECLAEAIEEAASKNREFSIKLSHLGFFPKGNRTIVWAGLEKSSELMKLYNDMEKSLLKQGFPRNRQGLNPHITLGREIDLTEKFDKIKGDIPLENKEIKVTSISLMESVRIGTRLVYRPIFKSTLKTIKK